MSKESDKIIEVAERFIGLYEVKRNAAWDDPSTAGKDPQAQILVELMEEAGWQKGWAYCSSFVEAVWGEAYEEIDADAEVLVRIAVNITPSVMKSFANWDKEGCISKTPTPGSIFFMQKGKTGYGHAGIVVKVDDNGKKISTIEGNTSPDPNSAEADREGDGVFRRIRSVSFEPSSFLWMRGFLNPLEANVHMVTETATNPIVSQVDNMFNTPKIRLPIIDPNDIKQFAEGYDPIQWKNLIKKACIAIVTLWKRFL